MNQARSTMGHEIGTKAACWAYQQRTQVPQCPAVVASFLSTTCLLQLACSLLSVRPQTTINKQPLLMLAALSG